MAIWRCVNEPIIEVPNATDGHGWTIIDGEMLPLWYKGNCLPQILVDDSAIVAGKDVEHNDSDSEGYSEDTLYELSGIDTEDDY